MEQIEFNKKVPTKNGCVKIRGKDPSFEEGIEGQRVSILWKKVGKIVISI